MVLKKCLKFTILLIGLNSCALFQDPENPYAQSDSGSVFAKGQTLVAANDFENALPYLKRTLEQRVSPNIADSSYNKSLLLLARCYDQLAEPEKAILALEELKKNQASDKSKDLTIYSLLLKNKAKIKQDISQAGEKSEIIKAVSQGNLDKNFILDNLGWSLDFRCDQYCLQEILFFKEIQLSLLYILEQKDQSSQASNKAYQLLKGTYEFFYQKHLMDSFSDPFKKQLGMTLLDSLRKLKALDLAIPHSSSAYPSKRLLTELQSIEKNLESSLYQ